MLTITNDNDTASRFKVTIRILFVFGRITVLIIHIRPNSKNPVFGTALVTTVWLSTENDDKIQLNVTAMKDKYNKCTAFLTCQVLSILALLSACYKHTTNAYNHSMQ